MIRNRCRNFFISFLLLLFVTSLGAGEKDVAINRPADGYLGIWYMNQPSNDKYVYKYSGGLGTYCAKHRPFAVYCKKVDKTFFCYGGATEKNNRQLMHMVSYFDHRKKVVPRPTTLLDKKTNDAHDNPVISVDGKGYVWIFSTSHGRQRPSYIHRSKKPYSVEEFVRVDAVRKKGNEDVPITNFSYFQVWHLRGRGFVAFFTRYNYPASRTTCFTSSPDGVTWSEWQRIGIIEQGHYQVTAVGKRKTGSAFNFHPKKKGVNWRTNLYYVETPDFGKTWQTAAGKKIDLPLREKKNPALIHDCESEGLNVYMKDIVYDEKDRPVILYVTSKGYKSGPANDPRTWTIARWTGRKWDIRPGMTSDNNYDMGSLYLEEKNTWRLIAPTATGPQPYNPGGEVAMWLTRDEGKDWKKLGQLTQKSERNHTYVRRPVNANADFYALWADGHGRKPSISNLYFCDIKGRVYLLPRKMEGDFARPKRVR